jgi:hypothetical protein
MFQPCRIPSKQTRALKLDEGGAGRVYCDGKPAGGGAMAPSCKRQGGKLGREARGRQDGISVLGWSQNQWTARLASPSIDKAAFLPLPAHQDEAIAGMKLVTNKFERISLTIPMPRHPHSTDHNPGHPSLRAKTGLTSRLHEACHLKIHLCLRLSFVRFAADRNGLDTLNRQ